MLNAIIRFALQQRLLVIAVSLLLLGLGAWQAARLEIDVFPNLNRPRVVVMTEAPGLAPEEVEALITFPLETAINGASGVIDVRSQSGVGMSVVYVEFDWNTDIYNDRQVVNERLALVADRLPKDVQPTLAPISSIMGQVLTLGMWSYEQGKDTLAGRLAASLESDLNSGTLTSALRKALEQRVGELSSKSQIWPDAAAASQPTRWLVRDPENHRLFSVRKDSGGGDLELHRLTSDLELRTLGDWVVRQRLLTIPGVSQVFTMGGGRKQFQVLIDPEALRRYGITLHQVREAVEGANENATGGYLDEQGPNEWLVRSLGRVQSLRDLESLAVAVRDNRPVTLQHVARVVEGAQVKRGDSSAFVRGEDGTFSGGPAVVLTINKQPGADTRRVTRDVLAAIGEIKLPPDVRIQTTYSQRSFIDRAIENVALALRDGAVLVVIILFLFLLNLRTTLITLTAIPLSLVVTALVFAMLGLSINTMTLGGLAVAMGELVDDAIVDVENIFRRLRENRHAAKPKHPLLVVYQASVEIRNSIVFSTIIIVLVFVPLFALHGMEGRLFAPLGVAYIVSILASLLVSLTVTPVLSYWLLAGKGLDRGGQSERESWLLRRFKAVATRVMHFSLRYSTAVFFVAAAAVAVAVVGLLLLERDFLPPFNEGAMQLNVVLPPGTSLKKSGDVAVTAERRLMQIPEIVGFARRTGRAELDEHAEGVNTSEFIIDVDPHSQRSRAELIEVVREAMADIPGIASDVEQPIAHLISHMISGVKAQVGIKLFGDDLATLRRKADEMQAAIRGLPGVKDLREDQKQVGIPQLQVRLDRHQLQRHGITPRYVNQHVQTAMNGLVVSQVLLEQQQQTLDLVLRMDDRFRENRDALRRMEIELPVGGAVPLSSLAEIQEASGPSTIKREKVRRHITLQCNVAGRGLVDVVNDIKSRLRPIEATLPPGYFIEYGGQFQAQQEAATTIVLLFLVALIGMFLVLYTLFRSVNLSLQVMAALPMAFIGSVAALWLTGQTLTIAAMVGFISMAGIASRNGILLLNHYLHLMKFEEESLNVAMVVRGSLERLAPVLMTALTAGIALVPLALAAGQPGKEILYPVATVIIGGLISSTLLEYFIHPALFSKLGRRSAERLRTADATEPNLTVEPERMRSPAQTLFQFPGGPIS